MQASKPIKKPKLVKKRLNQMQNLGRKIATKRELKTDNVLPGVGDFPGIVRNIRNARRGRSVSIGPQSAADAYETLAYRERRRRYPYRKTLCH